MKHIFKLLLFYYLLIPTNTTAENSWSFGSDDQLSIPMIIGNLDSEIRVVEYRSLTCVHCADFANNGYLHLKKKYIDTGLISFELRPLPLNPLDINAFKLLYCADEKKLFDFDKTILKNQKKWFITEGAKTWKDAIDKSLPELLKQSALYGVSEEDYNSCSLDGSINDLLNDSLKSARKNKIESTPSFLINGDLYEGSLSAEKIDEILEGYIN
ncbi:DsbA family protein [Pelagibacteraceae bacterium]|jgi:protein-disulfide isomerase|nr:DsbA family protein [Pelagibacteraceae bacterium]